MKREEYISEVMPDGHISLPIDVAKGMGLEPHSKVRIIIEKVEKYKGEQLISNKAKKKALTIKQFISDIGPEDFSERFREKYK